MKSTQWIGGDLANKFRSHIGRLITHEWLIVLYPESLEEILQNLGEESTRYLLPGYRQCVQTPSRIFREVCTITPIPLSAYFSDIYLFINEQ